MSMTRLDPSNHPGYVKLLLERTVGTADTSTGTSCMRHQSVEWFDHAEQDSDLTEMQQLMTEKDQLRRQVLQMKVIQHVNNETVNTMVKESQSSPTSRKVTRLCDLRASIPQGSTCVFHFRLRLNSGNTARPDSSLGAPLALPVEGGWQQQSSYHMRFAYVLHFKLQVRE